MAELVIRPLEARDRDEWAQLWTGYLEFYETSVKPEIYASTFTRLWVTTPAISTVSWPSSTAGS